MDPLRRSEGGQPATSPVINSGLGDSAHFTLLHSDTGATLLWVIKPPKLVKL